MAGTEGVDVKPRTPKACCDRKPQLVQAVTTEGTVGPCENAMTPEAALKSAAKGWLKNPSSKVN